MNVLFVTHHYLHGNGGGVFASRAYINAFAEIAEHVTLLYPYKDGMEIEKISPQIEAIPVRDEKSRIRKMFRLLYGKLHRYYDIFEPMLVKGNYDLVVFDNSRVSLGLIDVAHQYNKRVITIHHNCELEYVRDNSRGLLGLANLYWTKRQEKQAVLKSDLNLTITRQDLNTFARLYLNGKTDRLRYLGCYEYERFVVMPLKDPAHAEKKRFVITGNLSATQTEKALLEWLNMYYPIMYNTISGVKLVIAGKNPGERLRRACAAMHIELIPSPVSMTPILEDADIYICPINLGGGLKLRIMDGLKHGLPVVAHKVAARGYDEFVQLGCVHIYDNPNTFAKCLDDIVKFKVTKNVVLAEYRRLFSFEAGVQRMKRIILSDQTFAK